MYRRAYNSDMKHRQVQHSTSTTTSDLLRCRTPTATLACAQVRASSELGYRPIRCRDAHPAASLPKKGTDRLPAYRHDVGLIQRTVRTVYFWVTRSRILHPM